MGLGSFADVGLAEVQERSAGYRKQVKRGLDPIVARRIRPTAPTFTACAARYVAKCRRGRRGLNSTEATKSVCRSLRRQSGAALNQNTSMTYQFGPIYIAS